MNEIVTALCIGAAALTDGALKEAGKDAYNALKTALLQIVSPEDVKKLEQDPTSKARKSVIDEDLEKAGKAKYTELAKLAQSLLETLRTESGAATGIIFKDVEAVNARLKEITSSGTGVSIEHSRFSGDIEASNISSGIQSPGKPER